MNKKKITVIIVIFVVIFFACVGFKSWCAKMVEDAKEMEDVPIDISMVADGTYHGHSEMGPVIVDVRVIVQKGTIMDIEILKHQNGLGQTANEIVKDIVEQNTYEVDTISGATVSSEIIMNAVNDALQKGMQQ